MNCDDLLAEKKDGFQSVIESYYLETQEGLFFAVKGLEHPPDRFIAVLRYAPDSEKREREKDGITFRRFYHFDEQEQFIRTDFPHYLAYDSIFQATMQCVPRKMIQRVYDPRRRLQELTGRAHKSALEEDAAAFTHLLKSEAQVPGCAFGLTGSLLIGLNTEHSDLDIVVFGAEDCRKVHRALKHLLDTGSNSELHRLDDRGMEELYGQRLKDTHMEFHDFVGLEKRKANQGSFRGRPYFARFVKGPNEAGPPYGALHYTPIGRAAIAASIADNQDAIFTPCRYILSDIRILEGPQVSNLVEIASFRGRFCEQALNGSAVRAVGTLERIHNNRGEIWYRLLLGNTAEDTMVLLD